jgi:undecaprenyl-diphosphatase
MPDWLSAILLGILEGATEFIPVSSTGHLLLAQRALHLEGAFWDAFAVMIQLGAVLAVVVVYFQRLITPVLRLPTDANARRFALAVIIGCVPAGIIGAIAHHFIEGLFGNIPVICAALILGGIVLILLDRWTPQPRYHDATNLPLSAAAGVGLVQCLAFIPGVSRSGSTIVGGLAMGLDRRAAAEFSFFLAIPIMVGAFILDFKSHYHDIGGHNLPTIAIGFVVSFIVGLVAIRAMIAFVSSRGYGIFGWWRIVVGLLGLGLFYFVH